MVFGAFNSNGLGVFFFLSGQRRGLFAPRRSSLIALPAFPEGVAGLIAFSRALAEKCQLLVRERLTGQRRQERMQEKKGRKATKARLGNTLPRGAVAANCPVALSDTAVLRVVGGTQDDWMAILFDFESIGRGGRRTGPGDTAEVERVGFTIFWFSAPRLTRFSPSRCR